MRERWSASGLGVRARSRDSGPAVALALALAALGGCGEEAPPAPSLRLEVGTGREFTALQDGAILRVQRGCQGGQHVFVSLRAWELSPLMARVELALTRTEDSQVVSLPFRVRLPFSEGSGPGEPARMEGLLLVVPEPSEAVGRQVRLTATIESESGQQASDARTGTVQLGPDACP